MTPSPGKVERLRSISSPQGIIAAAALDQRKTLRKMIAAEKGIAPELVSRAAMEEFKEIVVRILSPYASAFLLDPELGVSAAGQRSKGCGLLYAYEQSEYDKSVPGRLPRTLEGYSVARLVQSGADCVKVLVYYDPSEPAEINSRKQDWVERVGEECAAADVPYFLELVTYHEALPEKSPEYALRKPGAVCRSIEEFSHSRYRVDVLKVEMPVNMAFVEGTRSFTGPRVYDRAQAAGHFLRAAAATDKPFIFLSAGVGNETFLESLDLASEAGVPFSGVLCGRAIWNDGVRVYVQQGRGALEAWLLGQGVRNLRNVTAHLQAATPWFSRYRSGPSPGASAQALS